MDDTITIPGADDGPTYNFTHAGHSPANPDYAVTGYDVVHTSWDRHGTVTIEIAEVVDGAGNYLAALDKAKAFRAEEGHYGYTANRYACGCRWVATALNRSTVKFRDAEPVGAGQ